MLVSPPDPLFGPQFFGRLVYFWPWAQMKQDRRPDSSSVQAMWPWASWGASVSLWHFIRKVKENARLRVHGPSGQWGTPASGCAKVSPWESEERPPLSADENISAFPKPAFLDNKAAQEVSVLRRWALSGPLSLPIPLSVSLMNEYIKLKKING